MEQSFFGLAPENKEDMILEPIFLMMYYCGFSWESFGLGPVPVNYKQWFIKRIDREFKAHKDKGEPPPRGAHNNSPEIRNLVNKTRDSVPSKLQRFVP